MGLHLPTGSLKTRTGLEPVSRCEPDTYQTIIDDIASHCAVEAGGSGSSIKLRRSNHVLNWKSCDAGQTKLHRVLFNFVSL